MQGRTIEVMVPLATIQGRKDLAPRLLQYENCKDNY